MKLLFTLLFIGLTAIVRAQGICTVNGTNANQSLQTICSQGTNPALVNGVFTGDLIIDNTSYTISSADLSAITFANQVTFRTEFKSHLTFAQNPTVAEGTTVTAEYGKHVHSSITAYGTLYEPNQTGRSYTDFANRMMNGTTVIAPGGGGEAMLPISLLNWKVALQGDAMELNWTTAREVNNDYFTVEHSTDGVLFAPLTDVQGAGNSEGNRTYAFRHATPAAGTNFYRLLQTDIDGTTTAYPVITAEHYAPAAALAPYPNPASAGQTVNFPAPGVPTTARLFQLDGRLVASAPVSTDRNAGHLSLPANLMPGVYILQVGNHTEKLVVR